MKRRTIIVLLACIVALPTRGESAEAVLWRMLRPAGQGDLSPLPGMAETTAQGERLVGRLAGREVEITGYVLPVERKDDLVYEFLLVPWAGACSHTAPPSPNQLVHVFPAQPVRIDHVYDTVSVTGVLKPGLAKTQLFIMDGVRVLESGYRIGRASVTRIAQVRDPELRGAGSRPGAR